MSSRLTIHTMICLFAFCLCACAAPISTQAPFAATVPIVDIATQPAQFMESAGVQVAQVFPTNTPSPTPTLSPTPTPSTSPIPTIATIPPNTSAPSATPFPTVYIAPTAVNTNVPTRPASIANADPLAPTWTPPPPDPARQVADHYWLGRPASNDVVNWAARTYPYGGTAGGRYQVHHGIDIVNPRGTRVLAAADGVVIYAGDDLATRFGPINNYYGNLVVLQHPFLTPEGLPVYTLYGHMDRIAVGVGQSVREGEALGNVGATGVALGPHLHFEVRVNDPYDFGSTRNPDLWIRPYFNFGTLAGRVTDAGGNLLFDVTLMIESTESTRYAFSYASTSVNSDPAFGENFTIGDLPMGYYTVTVSENGRIRFRETIYVYGNRTTWLNVQLAL